MRHPNIIRPIKLTTTLPEDIRAKLDLHLYSDVEGRVPNGAIQKFLIARIQEFFGEPDLSTSEITEDLPEPGKLLDKTTIRNVEGKVQVQFPTNRRGLSLRPEQALIFASALIKASKEASSHA